MRAHRYCAVSRKLAVDLRKHVRKLDSYKPLTKEWNMMVDSLLHVSNIAAMVASFTLEDSLPQLWRAPRRQPISACVYRSIDFRAPTLRMTRHFGRATSSLYARPARALGA